MAKKPKPAPPSGPFFKGDHDQSIAKWLRLLADAIEAKQVMVYSFGKPEITVRKQPVQYQFNPDIRFLRDDPEVMRIFSMFPPGADS